MRNRLLRPAEPLEDRLVLAALPLGATPADTAEYMLGDVWVTVAALESNGSIDPDLEQWTAEEKAQVRESIDQGLRWWESLLRFYSPVHTLTFHIDYSMLEQPVATGYEPIARRSDDVALWADDFLKQAGMPSSSDYRIGIQQFNHAQRLAHQTDWAFTILVVDAERDSDGRFASGGEFGGAFAFAGGQFFVLPSRRPASTVAHETGHMFWALDEYPGSRQYEETRGYYATANHNAYDGNPQVTLRQPSIMDQASVGYATYAISDSAREIIGWRDSDHDGIFDVLDVPLGLDATLHYDLLRGELFVVGTAAAVPLPNRNPSGTGNSITLNRVGRMEVRWDHGPWIELQRFDRSEVEFQTAIAVPAAARLVELRVVDSRLGISSNILSGDLQELRSRPLPAQLQALDVNGDGVVSPLDALLVINWLNRGLTRPDGETSPNTRLDVNGDHQISPLDALLVINYLNASSGEVVTATPGVDKMVLVGAGEPELPADSAFGEPLARPPTDLWAVDLVFRERKSTAADDFPM